MDGYTFYLVLLGAFVLLIVGGGLIKKLLKKVDIDLDDEQLDAVAKAVSDAISQVEEINRKLIISGGNSMSSEEKTRVTTDLAMDLAVAAGVSKVKAEVLLKFIHAALSKRAEG